MQSCLSARIGWLAHSAAPCNLGLDKGIYGMWWLDREILLSPHQSFRTYPHKLDTWPTLLLLCIKGVRLIQYTTYPWK